MVTTKAGPWFSEVLLVENLRKVEQFEKLENLKKNWKLEKKVGKIELKIENCLKLNNLIKVEKF